MAKEFKGRVLAPGHYKGVAVVSHEGFNTLASFQKSALMGKKEVTVSDQNNKDLFGKKITGKALCLPITIGSTTGGMVLQVICSMGIHPACMLFSETIDSLAAAGVVLAKVWENSDIIVIDKLGKEFLETVKSDQEIEVLEDGTVKLL